MSVACLRDGQPVAGAVYNAALDEMNAAAVGLGATRDGAPLSVSDAPTVRDALLITGFPYDRGAPLDRQLAVLAAFLRAPVHGIRRDGSAAIDCCHVAGARADGFWEYYLKPWDMAAGVVILREAGALVTDVDGAPWTAHSESICCANPALHAEMLAVIGGASRRPRAAPRWRLASACASTRASPRPRPRPASMPEVAQHLAHRGLAALDAVGQPDTAVAAAADARGRGSPRTADSIDADAVEVAHRVLRHARASSGRTG